jgi:hypothetical protein
MLTLRLLLRRLLACGLWPLSKKYGFELQMKESPLSKVVVTMPQVTPVIGVQELGAAFEARIANATNLLVVTIILRSTTPTEVFSMGDSITFLGWPGCSGSPGPNPLCESTSLLLRHWLRCWERLQKMEAQERIIPFRDSDLHARAFFR